MALAGACAGGPQPAERAASASPTATSVALAAPSRQPADLPRFAEEQPVVAALTAAGMRVELIGASKFETLLGAPRRTRVFIGSLAGDRVGTEVLFLDAPMGSVRICTTPDPAPGFSNTTIAVDGQQVATIGGSQPRYFGLSARYFVFSSDARVRDALLALGLSVPSC